MRNVWTDSLRIAEPGARAETRGADGNRKKMGIGRGAGERGWAPADGFARRAVTVPGAALPLRGQRVTKRISLRPTVTGPRCSQKAAKQLAGG